MKLFTDQTGEKLELINIPNRVISLVPSITELLINMGINVVGRTKFCIHPSEKVKSIPIIGGTKNFRFETIHQLNPDLIIGNKEENYIEGITELRKRYPVFMTEIYSLSESLEMMNQIGQITNRQNIAHKLMTEIREKHNKIAKIRSGTVLYFIWKNPWMVAGKNTYIDAMLTHLGYQNAINEPRYPELLDSSITALNPDHVLLSSEPYPFKENDLNEVKRFFPTSQIRTANGEPYSWYGTRLLKCDF